MSMFFLFKQKTAYEMRISDWSSDVCSSDLEGGPEAEPHGGDQHRHHVDQGDVGERKVLPDGEGGESRPGHDRRRPAVGLRIEAKARRLRPTGRASCRDSVCQYV